MDLITILDSEDEKDIESPQKKIKTKHEVLDLESENKENQSEEINQTNNVKDERIPHYYLNNFFLVLNSVLSHHGHLLSEDESSLVMTFRELDEIQQRLYIRLWQRKGPWFRFHQINYREITNVQNHALVLESQGLAQVVLKPTPDNLPFLLDLLNLTELKQLITDAKISATAKALNRKTSSSSTPKLSRTPSSSKTNSGGKSKSKSPQTPTATTTKSPSLTSFFKPNTPNNNNIPALVDSGSSSQDAVFEIFKDPTTERNDDAEPTKKQQLIQSILSQKGQRTLDGIPSVSRLVWKQFFKEQGCMQLAQDSVKLFNRITHLFFLNEYTQQNLLLLADMKKISYAPYVCRKESKLFSTREDLLLYEQALKLEQVFSEYWQAQLFEKALPIANSAAKWVLATCDFSRDPVFQPSITTVDKPDNNNNKDNSQNGFVDLTDDSQSQLQSSEPQGSLNEEITFGTLSSDFEQRISGGFFTDESELKECLEATKTPKEVDELIEQKLFLARFTHGWVLARIITEAYKILEKQRLYESAVIFLRILLASKFLPSKRGKWWGRLSLNLEHLGRKMASLEIAECALKDPFVKAGCRLTLQRRVVKLSKPPRRWKVPIFTNMTLKEATVVRNETKASNFSQEITINGVLLRSVTGLKSKFMSENGSGSCNVEIFALEHYQTTYGWKGFHSENGIFTFLFGVYMWDVLFADVIDVFQTPFQNAPLDLNTEAFYPSRKELIEATLKQIETATDVSALLMDSWGKHQDMQCLGVQWDKYDLVEMVEVVTCFGGKALAAIFKLLCEDYRHWTSGFPDLILWNMDTKTSKLSEVKGPRDKLSDKQRAWIDQLLAAGADVEICHVAECS